MRLAECFERVGSVFFFEQQAISPCLILSVKAIPDGVQILQVSSLHTSGVTFISARSFLRVFVQLSTNIRRHHPDLLNGVL
jgi:hypothetical protein